MPLPSMMPGFRMMKGEDIASIVTEIARVQGAVDPSSGTVPPAPTTGTGNFNNLQLAGLLFESAATGIVAGTIRTQAGATALTLEVNRVDTSTAPAAGSALGDGVRLMAAVNGLDVTIINNTANIITVYPNGTDQINGSGAGIGLPIPPFCVEAFEAFQGNWYFDAGVGFSGALPTQLTVNGISAAGANQAAATPLPADFNRVTVATANQGVRLPPAVQGLDIIVSNKSGVQITVYGNGTDTIDGVAGTTGVAQMNNSVTFFFCTTAGVWETEGLATGYSPSGLQTVQFVDNITAAGTTQATGTPVTGQINTVATVAPGTGINLPASGPGLAVTVINTGINALTVYPAQGAADTINGFAAATGLSMLPGSEATFNCTATGAWNTAPATTKYAAYNVNAATASTTLTGANITGGAANVDLALTGTLAGAANAQLPTVAQMIAAIHAPVVGTSYRLRIINASAGAFAWTVTTNTGWTLNSTMTIAQNTWRDFDVTLTSLTTATLQNAGTGTYS